MSDHQASRATVTAARPPAYLDTPTRPQVRFHLPAPAPADEPALGVPDRSASASAPPDLEISSRSLFAFKADYSKIFPDIRLDEHYESFYNENPERMKLPPPLPNISSPQSHHQHDVEPARETDHEQNRDAHFAPTPPPPSATVDTNVSASLPPRVIRPSPTPPASSPHFSALAAVHTNSPNALCREDSNASFDDLIFRESRAMQPVSGQNLSSLYRDEESYDSQRPDDYLTSSEKQPSSSPSPTPREPSPPPQTSAQFHQSDASHLARQVLHDPPAQTNIAPHAIRRHVEQQALWKLEQMSLEERETAHSVYAVPTLFEGVAPSRSPFSPYAYSASTPGHAQAAAAAAAAVAVAAQQTSPAAPYRSSGWPLHAGADSRTAGSFENRDGVVSLPNSFVTPNGTMPDMFAPEPGPDDTLTGFVNPSQTISGLPYSSLPYRESSTSFAASRAALFPPQHTAARHNATRGRSSSPLRMEPSAGYGFPPYGSNNARYANSRGRAMPVAPEYVNAQAAAAAAAAAAAVYQSNGVNINGPISSLRSSSQRTGQRGNTRSDGRRGNGADTFARTGQHVTGRVNATGSTHHDGARSGTDRGASPDSATANGGLKVSSFNDVIGRAEELARDQHGCRFLQTKLEEGNVVYINSIFEECYEKFVDLMTDPFGNYLCQKLFEFCNDAQRLALVERCAPAIPHVSTNMHGTRAVQRMVECLSTPEQVRAVCVALTPAAVSLMKDINGNHVIQRCLHRMDPAQNQFVYDAVAGNCFELATHRHGCCVMQRCMDYASPTQRNQLAQQINANALPLVQNAFGNYVVQYVLELNDPVYTTEIIRRLRGHLAELSMQKFSSNVVEKGLQLGSRDTKRELIDELISEQDTMRRLLHDAYGNYVIQRALQIAEGPQLERICEAIRPHLHSLKQSPYGKRIQAKILKRMPKGIPPLAPSA